jgi:alpha-L-fucosidase 2
VLHNETNPYGFTGVHDWPTAFWFPEAAAWLCRHLYDHYRFTLDRRFLRDRAYPVLREVARFWLDELIVDPRDGTLGRSPPAIRPDTAISRPARRCRNRSWPTFHQRRRGRRNGRRHRFANEVSAALRRLDPGTRIGSWGQLQEWKGDWDDPADEPSPRVAPLRPAPRPPDLARHHPPPSRAPRRSPCGRGATAAPAGARRGKSTSGRAFSTATTPI